MRVPVQQRQHKFDADSLIRLRNPRKPYLWTSRSGSIALELAATYQKPVRRWQICYSIETYSCHQTPVCGMLSKLRPQEVWLRPPLPILWGASLHNTKEVLRSGSSQATKRKTKHTGTPLGLQPGLHAESMGRSHDWPPRWLVLRGAIEVAQSRLTVFDLTLTCIVRFPGPEYAFQKGNIIIFRYSGTKLLTKYFCLTTTRLRLSHTE